MSKVRVSNVKGFDVSRQNNVGLCVAKGKIRSEEKSATRTDLNDKNRSLSENPKTGKLSCLRVSRSSMPTIAIRFNIKD